MVLSRALKLQRPEWFEAKQAINGVELTEQEKSELMPFTNGQYGDDSWER